MIILIYKDVVKKIFLISKKCDIKKILLTKPYANDLWFSSVTSATYANTTEKVQAKTPLIEIIAKNHHVFMLISGIGAQVKATVISKKNFRPHTSDKAPINGAERKDKIPLMPIIKPFMRNVWSGNVSFNTEMIGMVNKPHAKNSKNITTNAWYTLASPTPELCEIKKYTMLLNSNNLLLAIELQII